jgi:hypothetical protein
MTFKELNLKDELLSAIEELGFEHPMPIQERTIPFMQEKLLIWLLWLKQEQEKLLLLVCLFSTCWMLQKSKLKR